MLSKTSLIQLNRLDPLLIQRIKATIKTLEENPFQNRSGTDIKKLITVNEPPLFRLRVGDYRIIYFVIEDEIRITEIIHRSKGYKWLN